MYWTGVSRRNVPRAGSTRKVGMADIMPDSKPNKINHEDAKTRRNAKNLSAALLYFGAMRFEYQGLPGRSFPSPDPVYQRLRRQVDQQENGPRSDSALPEGVFDKDDISIQSVSQTGASHAIAVAGVRVAFKLERIQGNWVIQEVRLGNGEWVKLDSLHTGTRSSEISRYAKASGASRRSNRKIPDQERHPARVHRLHFAVESH